MAPKICLILVIPLALYLQQVGTQPALVVPVVPPLAPVPLVPPLVTQPALVVPVVPPVAPVPLVPPLVTQPALVVPVVPPVAPAPLVPPLVTQPALVVPVIPPVAPVPLVPPLVPQPALVVPVVPPVAPVPLVPPLVTQPALVVLVVPPVAPAPLLPPLVTQPALVVPAVPPVAPVPLVPPLDPITVSLLVERFFLEVEKLVSVEVSVAEAAVQVALGSADEAVKIAARAVATVINVTTAIVNECGETVKEDLENALDRFNGDVETCFLKDIDNIYTSLESLNTDVASLKAVLSAAHAQVGSCNSEVQPIQAVACIAKTTPNTIADVFSALSDIHIVLAKVILMSSTLPEQSKLCSKIAGLDANSTMISALMDIEECVLTAAMSAPENQVYQLKKDLRRAQLRSADPVQ